ncbi:MAG: hypothetical protein RL311_542 [Bacteroidota bacterium]|jgi:hypothetical protein
MVYILYLVLGFLYILFYIFFPLFIWPPIFFLFLASPFYSVSKDQINFYLSSIRSCCCCCCSYCFKSSSSSSSVFDCSYLQNVLELRNYAKHTINATTTMIVLNTHLLLCSPIILSVTPRKKNNYFLSTSHLVYPFQKNVVLCCVVDDCICLLFRQYNAMQCHKKEKKVRRQRYGSYMYFKKMTDG